MESESEGGGQERIPPVPLDSWHLPIGKDRRTRGRVGPEGFTIRDDTQVFHRSHRRRKRHFKDDRTGRAGEQVGTTSGGGGTGVEGRGRIVVDLVLLSQSGRQGRSTGVHRFPLSLRAPPPPSPQSPRRNVGRGFTSRRGLDDLLVVTHGRSPTEHPSPTIAPTEGPAPVLKPEERGTSLERVVRPARPLLPGLAVGDETVTRVEAVGESDVDGAGEGSVVLVVSLPWVTGGPVPVTQSLRDVREGLRKVGVRTGKGGIQVDC